VFFVVLHSSQDTLEQEHAILTTLYLASAKNTDRALQSLATRVRGPLLEWSDEKPPLAVVLYLSTELIEGRVNAVAINRVQWGARLALTAVLSHFTKLESELELLWSGYNIDLTDGEMEILWTQTR
jgi:hypothetical protein